VKKRKNQEPFVQLFHEMMDIPAWKAMSHGAQLLYLWIKREYRGKQNNVYLSQRKAAKALKSGRTQVGRWFREHQHYGFTVMINPGCLGVDGGGKAPHFRLTEIDYNGESATKDYLRWDGTPFKNQQPRHFKKQNPGPENRSSLVQKPGPVVVQKPGPGIPQIPRNGGPETRSISTSAIHLDEGGAREQTSDLVADAPALAPNGPFTVPCPALVVPEDPFMIPWMTVTTLTTREMQPANGKDRPNDAPDLVESPLTVICSGDL
jgi:hypothetical protein